MQKIAFILAAIVAFSGCLDPEIYAEVNDPSIIAHPPSAIHVIVLSGTLHPHLPIDQNAPMSVKVYIHRANCTNAQSRSLGSDFDGYIRITIAKNNSIVARAQSDFKGIPDEKRVQSVYDNLFERLKWGKQF
jgi:hypothetical protein